MLVCLVLLFFVCNIFIYSVIFVLNFNFFFNLCVWFLLFLGRFIHEVLQPVLSKAKSGSCLDIGMNSVAENSETGFVFKNCEDTF